MRAVRFVKVVLKRLFRLNASPQKIAVGFGLGVFLGILPGTGPIAALVLATFFRVNRVAALLGSMLTNTWISIATIILSIKLGSVIMGMDWTEVYKQWLLFLKEFQWQKLISPAVLKIAATVAIGYFLIALFCAVICYVVILAILLLRKRYENKNRTCISG